MVVRTSYGYLTATGWQTRRLAGRYGCVRTCTGSAGRCRRPLRGTAVLPLLPSALRVAAFRAGETKAVRTGPGVSSPHRPPPRCRQQKSLARQRTAACRWQGRNQPAPQRTRPDQRKRAWALREDTARRLFRRVCGSLLCSCHPCVRKFTDKRARNGHDAFRPEVQQHPSSLETARFPGGPFHLTPPS